MLQCYWIYRLQTLSVSDWKVPLAASEDDDDLRAAESALKSDSPDAASVGRGRFGRRMDLFLCYTIFFHLYNISLSKASSFVFFLAARFC